MPVRATGQPPSPFLMTPWSLLDLHLDRFQFSISRHRSKMASPAPRPRRLTLNRTRERGLFTASMPNHSPLSQAISAKGFLRGITQFRHSEETAWRAPSRGGTPSPTVPEPSVGVLPVFRALRQPRDCPFRSTALVLRPSSDANGSNDYAIPMPTAKSKGISTIPGICVGCLAAGGHATWRPASSF
jgi:hypothetical protein